MFGSRFAIHSKRGTMIVIGFGFRARQGKNLCCDAILEQCAYSNISVAIYEFSAEVLAFCVEQGHLPPDAVRAFLTPEQKNILQDVGLAQRKENAAFWVERLWARIARERPQVALLPNLRYPNECEAVKEAGGVCVLVERFNPDGSQYIDPERNPNHISEHALRAWPWDYRLAAQTGQANWLQRQARALFTHLRNLD
jgi:hypothetical protein